MSNHYEALYRRLAREILNAEGKIGADSRAFAERLAVKLRAEGWQMTPAVVTLMTDYFATLNDTLKAALTTAVTVGASGLQSKAVLKLAGQAFTERWPDGLTLSDRLWRWEKSTRDGVQAQLQAGIKQSKATGSVVMAMQRAIERNHGDQRFKIVSEHTADWVEELHASAQAMIHNPAAKADWQKVVDDVEAHISELSRTGSRNAAERLLSQVKKAVEKGNEALLDNAVKWWTYDKQLYHLKRVVRTEMATAAHRAVLASAMDDPDIIGFQWRLSGSHPSSDICDYYANIEMGLGKGVFSKASVPPHKAHPHCMCLIIPRVTPIRQKGSKDYATFIQNTSPERQAQLLPQWAKAAMDDGVPLAKLVRADGLGLMAQHEFKANKQRETDHGVMANKEFADFVEKVTQKDYKARHEFVRVGTLPDFVMADAAVKALNPLSNEIHISDHQLRHSNRESKANRGAVLPVGVLKNLPNHLKQAKWFYDSKHSNVCAVFDIKLGNLIGKSVISINFEKGKKLRNSIVTSGIIKPEDMNNTDLFKEIK